MSLVINEEAMGIEQASQSLRKQIQIKLAHKTSAIIRNLLDLSTYTILSEIF